MQASPHETGGRPDVRGLDEELAAAGLSPKLFWWQCPELLAMVTAIESWRQRALGVQPELHTGAKTRRFALGLLLVRGLRGHRGVAWLQQQWQKHGRAVCRAAMPQGGAGLAAACRAAATALLRAHDIETVRRKARPTWSCHPENRQYVYTGRHFLQRAATEHGAQCLAGAVQALEAPLAELLEIALPAAVPPECLVRVEAAVRANLNGFWAAAVSPGKTARAAAVRRGVADAGRKGSGRRSAAARRSASARARLAPARAANAPLRGGRHRGTRARTSIGGRARSITHATNAPEARCGTRRSACAWAPRTYWSMDFARVVYTWALVTGRTAPTPVTDALFDVMAKGQTPALQADALRFQVDSSSNFSRKMARLSALTDRAWAAAPPDNFPGATLPNWATVWVHVCEMRQARDALGEQALRNALAALGVQPGATARAAACARDLAVEKRALGRHTHTTNMIVAAADLPGPGRVRRRGRQPSRGAQPAKKRARRSG